MGEGSPAQDFLDVNRNFPGTLSLSCNDWAKIPKNQVDSLSFLARMKVLLDAVYGNSLSPRCKAALEGGGKGDG